MKVASGPVFRRETDTFSGIFTYPIASSRALSISSHITSMYRTNRTIGKEVFTDWSNPRIHELSFIEEFCTT
jgi:hypothetical protein